MNHFLSLARLIRRRPKALRPASIVFGISDPIALGRALGDSPILKTGGASFRKIDLREQGHKDFDSSV